MRISEWSSDVCASDLGRLDELHTKGRGDRVEADLASGKPHGVIGELESLVAVHPMNEHLWALLALALYRAGRQVDSLNAYHRARAALLDVGVEPGRELDELHQRVLRHDASLAGPVPPALRAIGGRPTQLPPEIAGRAHVPFVGREARSGERSVGKECVSPCRSRWSTYH